MLPVSRPPDVVVTLPGSRSYTNRALLIAALASGPSTIKGALFSDDTRYMADALRALGLMVEADEDAATFGVQGANGTIPASCAELFVGNAGTVARFLTACLALGRGRYLLDGSERMRQRPLRPLLEALQRLGVIARSRDGTGCPPVIVEGEGLAGGSTWLDGSASSQFVSALMIVGPCTRLGIELELRGEVASRPFLDLTASSMHAFGAEPRWISSDRISVPSTGYVGRDYTVEPDAISASYFFAAAAVTGGRVRVVGLGRDSAQGDLRFVDVLERMGCSVVWGEGFVELVGPRELRGIDVDMKAISDTALTLSAIAPFATEPVTIRGVAHTRYQESDRISAAVAELRRLGASVDEREDGLTVYPSRDGLHGGVVQTYDDHRVAMSFALVGLMAPGVEIANPGCVAKTFPDYFERLDLLRQA